jgi:hypothetical protein
MGNGGNGEWGMNSVILSGWRAGDVEFRKVELTKLIHNTSQLGMATAKSLVDQLINGNDVEVVFSDRETAELFSEQASKLGVRIGAVSDR